MCTTSVTCTGKAAWASSGYLPSESADFFMVVNEWAWLRLESLLIDAESALGFSFGVRPQTEMKIWCVKACIWFLKVVSN